MNSQGGFPIVDIVWFVALAAVFWFLLLRPQRQEQKRRDEMLKSLQRGARVVTMGGLHGTITDLSDDSAQLKIADKVEVTVSRSSVAQVLSGKDKKAIEPRAKTPKADRSGETPDDPPADQ